MYFCAKQTHPVDIQRLAPGIFLAHKDLAFQVHQGGSGSCGDAVLPCAGFRNNSCFAHFFC